MATAEEYDCVDKLLQPSKKIIKKGFHISFEPFEKRVELWNIIRQNYETYEDGECGRFIDKMDNFHRSLFEISLIILSRSYKKNNEDFPPANLYDEKHIGLYEKIEQYNVFEIQSKEDIQKKLLAKDKKIMQLYEEYYRNMDEWVNNLIEDSDIRLPVRWYLKHKWNGIYKKKLNDAINELNDKYDWVAKLIFQWKQENLSAPNTPTGPTSGKVGSIYDFSIQIESDNDEDFSYQFDWGDGTQSNWLEKPNQKKSWSSPDFYQIKIKRRTETAESPWSSPLIIMISDEKQKEEIIEGSRLVEIGEAKWYENNFIGRLKRQLQNEVKIGSKTYILEQINEFKQEEYIKYLDNNNPNIHNKLPQNRYIIATLTEKKMFRKKNKITIKALSYSRIEQYYKMGKDTYPLNFDDINPYITEMMDSNKNQKTIFCIGSPTGFSNEILSHINGEEFYKNFLSTFSLCLIDLETGKLIINPHDTLATEFQNLCRLETDQERIAQIKKEIETMLMEANIPLMSAVKLFGSRHLVKQVFYELEQEKGYIVKNFKDIGLVLTRR